MILTGKVRYRRGDLDRAYFAERFSRITDSSGVYGEEGLVGREAELWLRLKTLTVEYAGRPPSRYEVEVWADTDKARKVGSRSCSSGWRYRSPSPSPLGSTLREKADG